MMGSQHLDFVSSQALWYQVYHGRFFETCKKKKAVDQAFRFIKLIPNPTMSTYNMLMSVCASSQDSEGNYYIHLSADVNHLL